MDEAEVRQVLRNWITEANSSCGELPERIDPASWVAEHFLQWWHSLIQEDLSQAESSLKAACAELERLGGWSNRQLHEALDELTHAVDSLNSLRVIIESKTKKI